MSNEKWKIQRNWQHRENKTQDEEKQRKTQHNIVWTPLCAS